MVFSKSAPSTRARAWISDISVRHLLTSVSSGKSQQIVIENNKGRLSQEEIERMVKEAEEFASEDEAQRKRIEALNGLSNFVYSLKSQMADQEGMGGKVSISVYNAVIPIDDVQDWRCR